MARMTVEDKLGVDKFHVNEDESHILVNKQYADNEEVDRVIRICPAALYKREGDRLRFDYLGCLECGSCRILSGGKVIKSWKHPDGAFGISFRQG